MLGRITILAALAAVLASAQSELPEARFLRVDYTFRDAAIPPAQIRQITAQIEKTSFDAPDSWEQELRIRRVALGQADVLVVRGPVCSVAQQGTSRRGFFCAQNSNGET